MPKYYLMNKYENILAPWAAQWHYEYFSDFNMLEDRKNLLSTNPDFHNFQHGECFMKNGQLCPHC